MNMKLKRDRIGTTDLSRLPVKPALEATLPISITKKKDLISLFNSYAIPAEYHSFYKSLLPSAKVRNVLSEANVDKDESESEL